MAKIAGVEVVLDPTSILLANPKPTLWIDSDVFIDFYSHISLDKNRHLGALAVEETRLNMQRSAWLAVALDAIGARTVSSYVEIWDRNMMTKAPPGSDGAPFVSTVAHIVKDTVCPRWDPHIERAGGTAATPDGERPTTNDERDQFMVDLCREFHLDVISRDRGVRRRARSAGVNPHKPQVFAEGIIEFGEARSRFLERLEPGLAAWMARSPDLPRAKVTRAVEFIRGLYVEMWRS